MDNFKRPELLKSHLQKVKYNVVNKYKWDLKNSRVADFSGEYELNILDGKNNIYHIEGVAGEENPEYINDINYNLLNSSIDKNDKDFVKVSKNENSVILSICTVFKKIEPLKVHKFAIWK